MKIGKKIYFDKSTGNVIMETSQVDFGIKTTKEQDILTFSLLSERNKDTFDFIELEYGAYAQDFAECNGYRIHLETKLPVFSYPDPNDPVAPPVYQTPLTEQISALDERLALSESAIDFLIMNGGL